MALSTRLPTTRICGNVDDELHAERFGGRSEEIGDLSYDFGEIDLGLLLLVSVSLGTGDLEIGVHERDEALRLAHHFAGERLEVFLFRHGHLGTDGETGQRGPHVMGDCIRGLHEILHRLFGGARNERREEISDEAGGKAHREPGPEERVSDLLDMEGVHGGMHLLHTLDHGTNVALRTVQFDLVENERCESGEDADRRHVDDCRTETCAAEPAAVGGISQSHSRSPSRCG